LNGLGAIETRAFNLSYCLNKLAFVHLFWK
jgi:hypothetical protein